MHPVDPTTESSHPGGSSNAPSMQPILRSQLLPRISFRMMLLATAVVAFIFFMAQAAGDGVAVARMGLTVLLIAMAWLLLAAVAFLKAWIFAKLVLGEVDNRLEGSPFAENQLPPQQLPPREPSL